MTRISSFGLSVLAAPLLAASASAQGGVPLQDDGFASATPLPTADLVVVRERSYDAIGVDLSAYGIAGGPAQYVQSIYFRLFVDSDAAQYDAVAGRVVFDAPIQILGIVTSGADLGGDPDDGIGTETDELFGVAANPDDYSEFARGFECCGTPGQSEFVCVTSPNSFVFGFNVLNGVDDFRVIVDYGDSFPDGLGFDVGSYDLDTLGGATLTPGIRVGNDANPTVLGSGAWGDVGALLHIPLTATAPPLVSCDIPVVPDRSVYVVRDTVGDTYVDGFDVDLQLPAPDQYSMSQLPSAADVAAGPDGLLYVVGQGSSYAVINVQSTVINETFIGDLQGDNVDLCWTGSGRQLFFARDTESDSHVDAFDVDTLAFVSDFVIPASTLSTPTAIAAGSDGLLYVSGTTTGFVSVDPATGAVTTIGAQPPGGTYVDMTALAGSTRLFLLRQTTPMCAIDSYDVATGAFTYGFASSTVISAPAGITAGPDGHLYVVGVGNSNPRGLEAFDASTGAVVLTNTCMAFPGSSVGIAFVLSGPSGVYCSAKVNSLGCTPSIGSSGVASFTSGAPFDITCTDVLNNKNGILFYGFGPNSAAFQGGTLCVQPPFRRTTVQSSGGNPPPNDCSGAFAFDFNAYLAAGSDPLLEPCMTVYAQFWYRDPQSASMTGLSDALGFDVGL